MLFFLLLSFVRIITRKERRSISRKGKKRSTVFYLFYFFSFSFFPLYLWVLTSSPHYLTDPTSLPILTTYNTSPVYRFSLPLTKSVYTIAFIYFFFSSILFFSFIFHFFHFPHLLHVFFSSSFVLYMTSSSRTRY